MGKSKKKKSAAKRKESVHNNDDRFPIALKNHFMDTFFEGAHIEGEIKDVVTYIFKYFITQSPENVRLTQMYAKGILLSRQHCLRLILDIYMVTDSIKSSFWVMELKKATEFSPESWSEEYPKLFFEVWGTLQNFPGCGFFEKSLNLSFRLRHEVNKKAFSFYREQLSMDWSNLQISVLFMTMDVLFRIVVTFPNQKVPFMINQKLVDHLYESAVATTIRQKGNDAFKGNHLETAYQYYKKSLSINDIDYKTHNNIALCLLKLSELASPSKAYEAAVYACMAIYLKPTDNTKAYYRAAKGLRASGNICAAVDIVRKGMVSSPSSELTKLNEELLESVAQNVPELVDSSECSTDDDVRHPNSQPMTKQENDVDVDEGPPGLTVSDDDSIDVNNLNINALLRKFMRTENMLSTTDGKYSRMASVYKLALIKYSEGRNMRKEAISILQSVNVTPFGLKPCFDCDIFVLHMTVYATLAMWLYVSGSHKLALEVAGIGRTLLCQAKRKNNTTLPKIICWPWDKQEQIPDSTPKTIEAKFIDVISNIVAPSAVSFTCVRPDCMLLNTKNGSRIIVANGGVDSTSVQMRCSDSSSCKFELHAKCRKYASSLYDLGKKCPTPDCGGTINMFTIFDGHGKIVSSESSVVKSTASVLKGPPSSAEKSSNVDGICNNNNANKLPSGWTKDMCVSPLGCSYTENNRFVNRDDPFEYETVSCSNSACPYGIYVHAECMCAYETRLSTLMYEVASVKARKWTKQQLITNTWKQRRRIKDKTILFPNRSRTPLPAFGCLCEKGVLSKEIGWRDAILVQQRRLGASGDSKRNEKAALTSTNSNVPPQGRKKKASKYSSPELQQPITKATNEESNISPKDDLNDFSNDTDKPISLQSDDFVATNEDEDAAEQVYNEFQVQAMIDAALKDASSKDNALLTQVQSQKVEIKNFKSRIEYLQSSIEQERQNHTNEVEHLKAQLKKHSLKSERAQQHINELEASNISLTGKSTSLENEISELTKKLHESSDELSRVNVEYDLECSKTRNFLQEVRSLQIRMLKLEASKSLTALEQQFNHGKSYIDVLHQNIEVAKRAGNKDDVNEYLKLESIHQSKLKQLEEAAERIKIEFNEKKKELLGEAPASSSALDFVSSVANPATTLLAPVAATATSTNHFASRSGEIDALIRDVLSAIKPMVSQATPESVHAALLPILAELNPLSPLPKVTDVSKHVVLKLLGHTGLLASSHQSPSLTPVDTTFSGDVSSQTSYSEPVEASSSSIVSSNLITEVMERIGNFCTTSREEVRDLLQPLVLQSLSGDGTPPEACKVATIVLKQVLENKKSVPIGTQAITRPNILGGSWSPYSDSSPPTSNNNASQPITTPSSWKSLVTFPHVDKPTIPVTNPTQTEVLEENDVCAICLEDLVFGTDDLETLSCNHCYHRACIECWFKGAVSKSKPCPTCRTHSMSENDYPSLGGNSRNTNKRQSVWNRM